MINQKQFLYVLQNEKYYTTFSADVEQFPIHQKFIEELNWNIFYDFENSIVKDLWTLNAYKMNMILNKQQFQYDFRNYDDIFDILKNEYKK